MRQYLCFCTSKCLHVVYSAGCHPRAYVSIRKHAGAYVRMREHTWRYLNVVYSADGESRLSRNRQRIRKPLGRCAASVLYVCTNKASKVSPASVEIAKESGNPLTGAQRQYLYDCTSKASKVSTSELKDAICVTSLRFTFEKSNFLLLEYITVGLQQHLRVSVFVLLHQ